MKINCFYILILILVIGCTDKDHQILKSKDFPVLVNIQTVDKKFKTDSVMSTSSSAILYIGKYKDSVSLNYKLVDFPFYPPPPPPPTKEGAQLDTVKFKEIISNFTEKFRNNPVYPYCTWEETSFKSWDKASTSVEIDTNTVIKQLVIDRYFREEYYPAYPILIRNNENDTIRIGYDRFIPLLVEAKDSTNTWMPIEKMFIFKCGNGINSIMLPPKNIILSSKVIYTGDYKTDLRIKLGDNYSNEFSGAINYSQFKESRWY